MCQFERSRISEFMYARCDTSQIFVPTTEYLNEVSLLSLIFQHTDEWKDFEEEEKKDYSGLKIQNLQINDDDNEKANSKQNESEEETEINEQGETVVKKKCGPWKVIQEKKKEEAKPPPGMSLPSTIM